MLIALRVLPEQGPSELSSLDHQSCEPQTPFGFRNVVPVCHITLLYTNPDISVS